MRSIGIAVIMTQIGSFVPCSGRPTVSPVSSIFVRIGASDAQEMGHSTFMNEMLDAANMINKADSKSLLLIDELGRGTSTSDGFAIAYSLSRHIALEIKCFSLFATHYYELTKLGSEASNVGNLYCDAIIQDQAVTLLYKVIIGNSLNPTIAVLLKYFR